MINHDDIILDVQVGSTGPSQGSIAPRYLGDSGIQRLREECIDPFRGLFGAIEFWILGGYTPPLFGGFIPLSVLPNPRTGFRTDLDAPTLDFINGIPHLISGVITDYPNVPIYSYVGNPINDPNLMDCFLEGDSEYYGELRRQVNLYRNTRVIVDAMSRATRFDLRTFRTIMQATSPDKHHWMIPGVEGTPIINGEINVTQAEMWWLRKNYITSSLTLHIEDIPEHVRGPKVEMFRGMQYEPQEKAERIEYLSGLGIRSCCAVKDLP